MEIGNLLRVLAGGFESPSVKEEITKLEVRKRTLQLKLETLQPSTGITKAQLVEALRADAQRLMNDPTAINELLHKYIVRINIHDDAIEIIRTADFADAAPTELFFDEAAKKAYAASQTADGVNTLGTSVDNVFELLLYLNDTGHTFSKPKNEVLSMKKMKIPLDEMERRILVILNSYILRLNVNIIF